MLRKKLALLLLIVSPAIFAQDSTQTEAKPEKEFVKKTFENGIFINNQTVEGTSKKSLGFIIQHRFGKIVDERNLYGIFSSANIRLGLDYGITKRISVGFGATKGMYYDLAWKAIILKQAKSGGTPVTVTYFGNVVAKTGELKNFRNQKNEYTFANRCTFFNELMIARKFNKAISWQVSGSYSYFNLVADSTLNHGFIGLSTIAQWRITSLLALQVEFDYPVNPDMIIDPADATGTKKIKSQKPNLSFGLEYSTGQHQFQVFATTADNIHPQSVIGENTNDFTKKRNMMIGFNITREFGF